MKVSDELIAQAKKCETAEELVELALTNGITLPTEEAEVFLRDYCEGELSDNELDAVSGGARGCKRNAYPEVWYPTEESVQFIFDIGDMAEAFVGSRIGNETATVRITQRKVFCDAQYQDVYKYDRIDGSPTCWGFAWQSRDRFEMRS